MFSKRYIVRSCNIGERSASSSEACQLPLDLKTPTFPVCRVVFLKSSIPFAASADHFLSILERGQS